MPSWWVRMSTATYMEAHASQTEYFWVVSSVGSEVRQVDSDPSEFLGLLAPNESGAEAGLKEVCDLPMRALVQRDAQTRRSEGAAKGGSNQGMVVIGFACTKSG